MRQGFIVDNILQLSYSSAHSAHDNKHELELLEELVTKHAPHFASVIIHLHAGDADIQRRFADQFIDPLTGKVYPVAQVEYSWSQHGQTFASSFTLDDHAESRSKGNSKRDNDTFDVDDSAADTQEDAEGVEHLDLEDARSVTSLTDQDMVEFSAQLESDRKVHGVTKRKGSNANDDQDEQESSAGDAAEAEENQEDDDDGEESELRDAKRLKAKKYKTFLKTIKFEEDIRATGKWDVLAIQILKRCVLMRNDSCRYIVSDPLVFAFLSLLNGHSDWFDGSRVFLPT
jgi:hypothetical protein